MLYVGIFSYTSHGCAYHTNCLSKKQKNKKNHTQKNRTNEKTKMISLSVGVSSLKKKINDKYKCFKFS